MAFACGSRSTTSTCSPASARQAARLTAVVVFPTPPFWFARAKTVLGTASIVLRGRTASGRFLAIPGRRGKPGGVGATLGMTMTPRVERRLRRRRPSPPRAPRLRGPPSARRRARLRPLPNERQAPLGGHRRRRERPRDGDAVPVDALLLGAAADNPDIREAAAMRSRKAALRRIRLEQRHLAVGQRGREGNARGAAAGSHVDDRPVETSDVLQGRQAALDVYAMRLAAVARSRSALASRAARRATARAAGPSLS